MRKILLVNDTRTGGHHGSSAVIDVIIQQFSLRRIEVVSHVEARVDLDHVPHGLADAVVINGEGTMHSGQKNAHRFARLAEHMAQRGTPVFLINTVFDEQNPEILGRMKHFAAIYCRESFSANRLSSIGIAASVCPDLTYAIDVPPDLAWQPGERMLILDTTLADKNRVLHQFAHQNALRFQPLRTSPRVIVTDARTLARVARFNAVRFTGKLLPQIYKFGRYGNALASRNELLHTLADGTRVVVSGRFHGVCFCMKIGVPFLAISSNTAKIEGMLTDAGLSDRMIDIADLTVDRIAERAPWTAAHETHRQQYVALAQTRIKDMFDTIARTLA